VKKGRGVVIDLAVEQEKLFTLFVNNDIARKQQAYIGLVYETDSLMAGKLKTTHGR